MESKNPKSFSEDLLGKVESESNPKFNVSSDPLSIEEIGSVSYVTDEFARVKGLRNVKSDEIVSLGPGIKGMAYNLEPESVGVILLDRNTDLKAGMDARRTYETLDAPVGDAVLGRVINALGDPLDDLGELQFMERQPIERESPAILDRSAVTVPLQTGYKVIDSMIPIGRGQRQLILGDRQTGKTSLALDTILNQKDKNVICIYCSIGQRGASVAQFISDLKQHGGLEYTAVVVGSGEDTAGLQFITPYAATTMAEYFMHKGRDVLIVYDDLTRHAQSYRELSLLMRRPPGREAYPGDIFYIHSRLLERSTHLSPEFGGGSLTALPIIETEAQNFSAYIPTNIISITDGQIYLSSDLFQKGILPPIDIGKSVSRVGGKTQLKAYREISGNLRLSISQFEELEIFAKFGTKLDADTISILDRGRRIREVLQQKRFKNLTVFQQILMLTAVNQGLLDPLELPSIQESEERILSEAKEKFPDLESKILNGESLEALEKERILEFLRSVLPLVEGTQS